MALLAQGFDPSGYTPDYSVANRANEQYYNAQQQGIGTLTQGVIDAQKQQKDLAQKDKEMAAKIKGTLSLLDNAKALYPDFAQQIDANKIKLSDPSLSNLDKSAIADGITSSLNLIATQGSDKAKIALIEAQTAELKKTAPIKSETITVYDPSTGQNITGLLRQGETQITPLTLRGESKTNEGLGDIPKAIPTVEGDTIDPTTARDLGYDSLGRKKVLSEGKIYHINLEGGVLPDTRPLDVLSPQEELKLIEGAKNLPVGLTVQSPAQSIEGATNLGPKVDPAEKLRLEKLALEIKALQSNESSKANDIKIKQAEADLAKTLRENRIKAKLEESGQSEDPKKLQEINKATEEFDAGEIQKAVNRLNAVGLTSVGMPISKITIEDVLGTKKSRQAEDNAVIKEIQTGSNAVQPTLQEVTPQSLSSAQQEVLDSLKKANPTKSDSYIIEAARKNNLWPN